MLEHKLYLLDPELRSCMLKIRETTASFMNWKLLDLDKNKLRTIDEFVEA